MVHQGLRPGVQDQCDSQLAAEPAWVSGELLQGLGGGFKQQSIQHTCIESNQLVQGMRQGEHHVEVRYRQQLSALPVQPVFLGPGLALRTMTVTAGVKTVVLPPAAVARRYMPTHRFGSASGNRA